MLPLENKPPAKKNSIKSMNKMISQIDKEVIDLRKQELTKIDAAIKKLTAKKAMIEKQLEAAEETDAMPKVETLAKKIEEKKPAKQEKKAKKEAAPKS